MNNDVRFSQWGPLAALALITGFIIMLSSFSQGSDSVEGRALRKVVVATDRGAVVAEIADTEDLRIKGLLGKTRLGENEAMLLDFINPGMYAIHMQGMAFSIDAVWMDRGGKVVNVYHNIEPDSGRVYPSIEDARFCLETHAGAARRLGVKIGSKLRFLPE